MPLYTNRVSDILNQRSQDFQNIDAQTRRELDALQTSLDHFRDLSQEDVEAAITEQAHTGALPTDEQDTHEMIVPFEPQWTHHQASRKWAAEQLTGVTTFAADGSQIAPAREMSIQVGLVQIGWFLNPHRTDADYEKDVAVTLLTHQEFEQSVDGDIQREMDWRRFQGEIEATRQFLENHAGQKALAFFDGSFVVSFVGNMQPERQEQYVEAVKKLLAASHEAQVPLIGYIDNSYSSDLVTLIQLATGRTRIIRGSDASLLRPLMSWGERSRVYRCNRHDDVVDNDYYQNVCITYLKTTRDNSPARIEFPVWMLDSGQHEWALDIVRAECCVGLGYPYPLETADATAVLTMQDRNRFHRMFQQFAERENLDLRFSRKSMSKRGRR